MRKGAGGTRAAFASLSTHREILRRHKVVGELVPALEVKSISMGATEVRISTTTGNKTRTVCRLYPHTFHECNSASAIFNKHRQKRNVCVLAEGKQHWSM